jgi:hypothetical protein
MRHWKPIHRLDPCVRTRHPNGHAKLRMHEQVDVQRLVVELAGATVHGRPVLRTRHHPRRPTSFWRQWPPTLNRQWGGLLRRRQLSRWRERTIGLLVCTSRRCTSSRQQRLTRRPLSRSIGRLADTNGLVAALVVATYLGRPIRRMRPFPPTLSQ